MCPFDPSPTYPDEGASDGRFGDRLTLAMAGMIQDCQATGAALLKGDLTQALAKTITVQRSATTAGFSDIRDAADGLSHAIVATSEGRPNGIGLAFDRLARAIDRRLNQGQPPSGNDRAPSQL